MSTGRRDFLKRSVEAAALLTAGAAWPGCGGPPDSTQDSGVTWRKAPCRFCGTGCGTLVGTQEGRAVAVQGDILQQGSFHSLRTFPALLH